MFDCYFFGSDLRTQKSCLEVYSIIVLQPLQKRVSEFLQHCHRATKDEFPIAQCIVAFDLKGERNFEILYILWISAEKMQVRRHSKTVKCAITCFKNHCNFKRGRDWRAIP